MAAEEKQTIVIKKITEAGHGHHGGAWKVAFADFMTAMMAFFLVMWLLNQTEDVKKQVASYFTGPSMIEHQFTSYGAELTLEKLFLDLVNQPLKTVQEFMQPADFTPNLMSMGSKKMVIHTIAQELGSMAANVTVESDTVTFEISDKYFFERGSNKPSGLFIDTMKKVEAVTMGLEDSAVEIKSQLFYSEGSISDQDAGWVAQSRLDIIQNKVLATFEHDSNDVVGNFKATKTTVSQGAKNGMITFEIKQKEYLDNGRKPRPLSDIYDKDVKGSNPYETFIKRAAKTKKNQNK